MAANLTVGAHGREISAAEAAWSNHPDRLLAGGPITFHDVLDALNPLQYVPVVGTIYRVITGDDGSLTLRTGVSLIAGAVIGGPLGLLTSMAGALFEHFFPFEHMARAALVAPAPAQATTVAAAPAATPPAATPSPLATTQSGPAVLAAAGTTSLATIAPAPPANPVIAAQAVAAYDRADAMAQHVTGGKRER